MDEIQLSIMKAIAWTEAKAKLEAVMDVEGHRRLIDASTDFDGSPKYHAMRKAIRNFIKEFEYEGLNE